MTVSKEGNEGNRGKGVGTGSQEGPSGESDTLTELDWRGVTRLTKTVGEAPLETVGTAAVMARCQKRACASSGERQPSWLVSE